MKRQPIALARLTVLGLVLSACAPTAPDQTDGQRPGQPPAATLPPLSVSVMTDDSRSATQLVPVEGDTLTATGADGTTFVLTIPPQALLAPTQISMTPLASLTGLLADDSLLAGVKLEPEGLELYDLAILEIRTPGYQARESDIALAYAADGEQLHAHPLDLDTSTLRMPVSHFSGYAAAQARDAQRAAYFQAQVDAQMDQVAQKIARVLSEERRRQLLGDESGGMGEVADLLSSPEILSIIQWALDQSEQYADDCDALETVAVGIRTYLAFERQMQLLGSESSPQRQAFSEQATRIFNQAALAAGRCLCADELSPVRIRAYLGFERTRQLLGLGDAGDDPVCEWDFNMTVSAGTPEDGFEAEWTGKFSVSPLGVLVGAGDITGAGTIAGEFVSSECTVPTDLAGGEERTQGRFQATVTLDYEMTGRGVVEGELPDAKVFLELDPRGLDETIDMPTDPDGCYETAEGGTIMGVAMLAPTDFLGTVRIEAKDGSTLDETTPSEMGGFRREVRIELAD